MKCNADGIIFDLNLIFEEAILDLRIDFNFKMQTKPDSGLDLRSGVKIYWRQKPDSACRQFMCVAGLSGIDSGHVSLVQPHLIYVQRGGVVVDLIPMPQSFETAKRMLLVKPEVISSKKQMLLAKNTRSAHVFLYL